MEAVEEKKQKPDHSDKAHELISLAKTQFKNLESAESHNREASLEDLRFCYNVDGGQWEQSIKKDRDSDERPSLTHNKLRKYAAQVANRERMNRIAMDTVPVDDKADVNIAKIYDGLIRQIESQSVANVIYEEVGEKAIAGGFGYFRMLTRYCDDSFDQEIYLELIENQFSVLLDPKGRYGFIRKVLSEDEFRDQYPDAEMTDWDSSALGDDWELWWEDGKIVVAEWFYKVPTDKTIVQVRNEQGVKTVALTDEVTEELLKEKGYEILKKRTFKSHKVMWRKITGYEILEEKEWVGSNIPIYEVQGDTVNIGGKIYKRSLIRDGKDAQSMYNYWISTATEKVALVPKAPFLVTPEQIKGHEKTWDEANTRNFPYLPYNKTSEGKPQREQGAQIDTGIMGLLNIANNDIMDCLGMYESGFGQKSNERSGKAIRVRAERGEMGAFHFPDNLARAILQCTRDIVEIIPKVYDTERVVRILGEDGTEELMPINATVLHENKEIIVNDLSVGKYDVRPSLKVYGTRRQEAAAGMLDAMQYAPMVAPLIVDLLFKYQDWPGSDELKQRVEKYLPSLMSKQAGGSEPAPGGNPNAL